MLNVALFVLGVFTYGALGGLGAFSAHRLPHLKSGPEGIQGAAVGLSFILPWLFGLGLFVFWVFWRFSEEGKHHQKMRRIRRQRKEEKERQKLENLYDKAI